MKHKLEVISKAVAEKLEAHAEVIHNLIAAQRRGAAEQFGYAFLAGRALLQAKSIVPNGNSRLPNAGFKNWVAANLPEITMRTAENWMLFAESIISRAQVDAGNSPLLLGTLDMNGSAHDSVLKLVPEIMDGRGMMRFMRDTRLLRVTKRSRKSKQKMDPASVRRENAVRARRLWERIVAELEEACSCLANVERVEDLNRYLKSLLAASSTVRVAAKVRHAVQPKMKVDAA
jgi:hypothetical protein